MSTLLALDTPMDRAELRTLLDHLPPVQRLNFLKWACAQVRPSGRGHLPAPVPGGYDAVVREAYRCDAASERLTRMVYCDCLLLISQWNLDAVQLACALERLVRARR